MTTTPWVRRGLILVPPHPFPEPDDTDLARYRFTATPLADRALPTCGMVTTGRRAHLSRGEEPCADCKTAEAQYHAQYSATRRDAARAVAS